MTDYITLISHQGSRATQLFERDIEILSDYTPLVEVVGESGEPVRFVESGAMIYRVRLAEDVLDLAEVSGSTVLFDGDTSVLDSPTPTLCAITDSRGVWIAEPRVQAKSFVISEVRDGEISVHFDAVLTKRAVAPRRRSRVHRTLLGSDRVVEVHDESAIDLRGAAEAESRRLEREVFACTRGIEDTLARVRGYVESQKSEAPSLILSSEVYALEVAISDLSVIRRYLAREA